MEMQQREWVNTDQNECNKENSTKRMGEYTTDWMR